MRCPFNTFTVLCRTILIGATLAFSSVAASDEESEVHARAKQISEVNDKLEKAEADLAAGKLANAETALRDLRNQPYFHQEIDLLLDQVARVRRQPSMERAKKSSDAKAIDEVRERLILPEKYGQTRFISPDNSLPLLQLGPMERLAEKPVSLTVEDADLRTLIMTLSEIDGLNIIADDALTSDQTLSVNATDVPLREILGYVSRNMGVAFHFGKNVIWVTEADQAAAAGPQLETRMYTLQKGMIPEASGGGGRSSFGGASGGRGGGSNSFGGGGFGGNSSSSNSNSNSTTTNGGEDDVLTALTDFLENDPGAPADALFRVYRNQNLVMIRNTRENLRLAEELIKAFDTVPAQVLIEARYVTIGQGDLFQLGATIETLKHGTPLETPSPNGSVPNQDFQGAATGLPGFPTTIQSSTMQLSGVLDNVTYDLVISALEQLSSTQTMNAPRVTVFSNHTARLRRGQNRFYFDEFEQESTGGDQPVTSTVPSGQAEELELGTTLEVTPSVGADMDTINLGISAEILKFEGFDPLTEDISLPITDEESLSTVLAVNSGETVVIGGMLTSVTNDTKSQVPLLGDIPMLGVLFRKKEKKNEPEHLLIFVTATIIDPDGRLNQVENPDEPTLRKR